jgi:hypothetical protein
MQPEKSREKEQLQIRKMTHVPGKRSAREGGRRMRLKRFFFLFFLTEIEDILDPGI